MGYTSYPQIVLWVDLPGLLRFDRTLSALLLFIHRDELMVVVVIGAPKVWIHTTDRA